MKKLFVIVALFTTIVSYSQRNNITGVPNDDGLVTSKLGINAQDQLIVDFITGFNGSFEMSKRQFFASKEDVNGYLGFDLANYPRLEQIQKDIQLSGKSDISPAFISSLIAIRERIEMDISSVTQLRMALQQLATSGRLSITESRYIAMLDLALQRCSSIEETGSQARLPRWLRCTFSVIGGAIGGGLGGGSSGATIGLAFTPGGAAIGATVGAILGVVGGAFGGAAAGC